jgi:hypothetical protein
VRKATRLAPTLPLIERVNLSIRQHVAAVGRRVSTLCKGEDGLRQQLALYHVYYNFCLPHASLRKPCRIRCRPTGQAPPSSGGPVRPPWPRGSPSMCGPSGRCSCSVCRRGPSQRGYEHAGVGGNGNRRGPEVATCACTASVEGVTRTQRAAGRL